MLQREFHTKGATGVAGVTNRVMTSLCGVIGDEPIDRLRLRIVWFRVLETHCLLKVVKKERKGRKEAIISVYRYCNRAADQQLDSRSVKKTWKVYAFCGELRSTRVSGLYSDLDSLDDQDDDIFINIVFAQTSHWMLPPWKRMTILEGWIQTLQI